jgi:hypothetical protein
MGKRSRKRPDLVPSASSRVERDARRAVAPAVARRGTRERPPAPWGSFPRSELIVLLALILGVIGFINLDTHRGRLMVAAAMILGSLGGLEVSIREHFAGFRSHTTLLAGSLSVLAMGVVAFVGGRGNLPVIGIAVAVGVLVFVLAFWGLREAFRRRSGGPGFR